VIEPTEKTPSEIPSAAACAEAAAWIARLHGEDRTAQVEAGFQRWLTASPEHQAAFEMANDIWESTDQLPKPPTPAFVRWPRAGLVVTLPRALAVAVAIAIAAIGVSLYSRDAGLATRVGEQRNLTLEDGTRISMNTASRVHVRYDRTARRVELDEGEAYFEVAKRPEWPFIVTAGGKQVVARGTAFVVRRDGDSLAVTLVEGKVIVGPARESVAAAGAGIPLVPGQRLTFAAHEQPKLDRPPLERVTAWQRGQIVMDHTRLADAVAEMNRYSRVTLKIEELQARQAEITGIFRVGDSESFALAVAQTYHLEVADRDGQIVLSGLPRNSGGDANKK